MNQRVDDPLDFLWRSFRQLSLDPAQRFQLLKYLLRIPVGQPPHAAVAALNIAIGDLVEFVGEDITCHVCQSLMIVCETKDTDIKHHAMLEDEIVQESRDAPCGIFSHDCRQDDSFYILDTVPQHAEPCEYAVLLSDMGCQLLIDDLTHQQVIMFSSKLISNCLRAWIEVQHGIFR